MANGRPKPHLADDALFAMIDEPPSLDPAAVSHIEHCELCAVRLGELREARRLLRAVGATEQRVPRNVAQDAIRQLRMRQKAVGNVNELFSVLHTFIRGLRSLWAGPQPPARGVSTTSPADEH